MRRGKIAVPIRTYIGSDTTIKGDLKCGGDFLIEGAVEGKLRSEGSILIGKEAMVRGEVVARVVAVSGTVIGTIQCLAKLEICGSAQIIGTVLAPELSMESGAKIHARVLMSKSTREHQLTSHSLQNPSSSDISYFRLQNVD
jgi:cytoskeletal protein CcmA (bactofilin family)